MTDVKVVRRSISLYSRQWELVRAVEQRYCCNTSQALRIIIEQHAQQQERERERETWADEAKH